MRNQEQIQKEYNEYLEKTSQHVFVKKLDNEKLQYFRLVDANTKDGQKLWFVLWVDEELKTITCSTFIKDKAIDGNSKNCVKHMMFLGHNYKSVKLKRKTQFIADSLRESVSQFDSPTMDWRAFDKFKKDVIEKVLLAQ